MFSAPLLLTFFGALAQPFPGSLQVQAGEPVTAARQDKARAIASTPLGSDSPLDWAFDAVSKMPLRPHVKTRSRLQADLVQAALDAGRLGDAGQWAARIDNWRQGLALAHIAVFHAQHGDVAAAGTAIEAAEAFEATILAEEDQGWRRDRVRVRIAEAYALLGNTTMAATIQAAATPSESGRLAAMAVRTVDDADAGQQMETLEAIARTGDLEQARFALLAMGEFYGRALELAAPAGIPAQVPAEIPAETNKAKAILNPEAIEARIRAAWTELPIEPRIDILERMVDFDIQWKATQRAHAHAAEVGRLVLDNRWNPEQGVALRARVSELLQRADDTKAARVMANSALALYDTSREGIVNIFRGEALRPVAEAYLALGDSATATVVYERALEEALVNPNSRPRAADLAMTAISATTAPGYKMPKSLLKAFRRAEKGIGAPW
ncbi:MAG: hypothetical protein ACJAQ3_000477 [Planctomycetota bacterium]|jgi:hypothetical protein